MRDNDRTTALPAAAVSNHVVGTGMEAVAGFLAKRSVPEL